MKIKTLSLALSALLFSGASLLAVAADEPKAAADQGTSMPQPDKAKADQGTTTSDQSAKPSKDVTSHMKSMDTDGDGAISKAEAGKMKGMAEGFDAADANKDGQLNAGEFATCMAQMKK